MPARKRRYCLRGHDTALVGRNTQLKCRECMRIRQLSYNLFRRPLNRLEQQIAAKAERVHELEQLLRDLRGIPA